jgi:type VI secretion system lysozyme-like protein
MSGLGIKERVRAPLFDRLSLTAEVKGERVAAAGLLDRAGQRESLQRELNRLLNTRSTFLTGKKGQKDERTVVDYGLPDYSAMYTRSTEDQKKLAELVRRTVEAFEPRLSQVKVDAEVLGNSDKTMMVKVSGNLANGRLMERVSFSLQVTGEDLRGCRLGS